MTTTFSTVAMTALITSGLVGTAFAQDEDPFADDSGSEDIAPTPEPAPSVETTPSSDGGDGDFYNIAISTTFPTGGDAARGSLLWGLDADTYLDIRFGFDINKGPDPAMPMDSATTIGTDIGIGYRMYKPTEGKIRPYLEPLGQLAIRDFSEAGDTLLLGVGVIMGVDYALMDQFTLGVAIGGGITFADNFDSISIGLFTNSINATFWW